LGIAQKSWQTGQVKFPGWRTVTSEEKPAAFPGGRTPWDQIFALVYEEIRSLASRYMRRERPWHTLQTTDLVNKAFLRLAQDRKIRQADRPQVVAAAAVAMRRILVSHQRRRLAKRHGGGMIRLNVDEGPEIKDTKASDIVNILALDRALNKLSKTFREGWRMERILVLRYFGGMTMEEAAEQIGISVRQARRDWIRAQAWLKVELAEDVESRDEEGS
jgi:RNA polymerase sigma factor (TIGR02999 family)